MSFQRYERLMAEAGIRAFERSPWINPRTELVEPRVLGEPLPWRWRVSPDEWERLVELCRSEYGWTTVESRGSFVAGFPITADASLPPDSVVFEPAPAGRARER